MSSSASGLWITVGTSALPVGAPLAVAPLQAALARTHEVFGALAASTPFGALLLARDRATGELIALEVDGTDAPARAEGRLRVKVRPLQETAFAEADTSCPQCRTALPANANFCARCGADLRALPAAQVTADLLRELRLRVGAQYDVLGTMERSGGRGVVFVARELASGRFVALRPSRKGDGAYVLTPTTALDRTAGQLADEVAKFRASQERAKAAPAPQRAPEVGFTPVATPDVEAPVAASEPAKSRWPLVAALLAVIALLAAVVVLVVKGRREATPPPVVPGTVIIGGTLPEGAVLLVDGKKAEPPTLTLPPGVYVLRVEAKGKEPASERVAVTSGQRVVWTPTLVALAPPPPPPSKGGGKKATPGSPCATFADQLAWGKAKPACEAEAKAGSLPAMRRLGQMYEKGLGVDPDVRQAADWYLKAGQDGDAEAQFALGGLYRDGRGVRKDPNIALDWYNRAANRGLVRAMLTLGQSYLAGDLGRKDPALAYKAFRSAADAGNADGQFQAARLLLAGQGVTRDEAAGLDLLRKAAAQGHAEAKAELERRGKA